MGFPLFSEPSKTFLRVVLLLFVFCALPLSFLEITFFIFNETERARNIEKVKIQHEKILARINLCDNEAAFLAALVKGVFRKTRDQGIASGEKEIQLVECRFPKLLEMYFFDGSGKLIPSLSSRNRPVSFLERCYKVIDKIENWGKSSVRDLGILRGLWKLPRIEIVRKYTHGKPMPIGEDPSEGYSSFERLQNVKNTDVSGYIAFFHPEKSPENLSIRYSIKNAKIRYPEVQIGYVDFRFSNPRFFPRNFENSPEFCSTLLKTISCYNTRFSDGKTLLTVVPRKRNGYVFAIQDLPNPIPSAVSWFLRATLLAWSLLFSWKGFFGSYRSETRIFWRIVKLFLFSAGLPGGLLLLGGYRALEDHVLVLQENLERTMREKLRQFDERFPLEIARIENMLKSLKTRAMQAHGKVDEKKIFEEVRRENSITEFMVIDPDGKSFWQLREPENSAVAQRYQIGKLISRELMKRINKIETIDGGTLVNESVSSFMGGIAEAGSWELFQRNLGQFTPFGLSNEGCFMLFDALFNERGESDKMICAVMFRGLAESEYFKKHKKNLENQPDLTWNVSLWARSQLSHSVFSKKVRKKDAEEIGKAVDSQLSFVRKIVKTSRGRELLIGQLGQNVQGYVYVAQTSLAPLERRVLNLWKMVAFFLGILVFATVVMGFFLSEQILVPIQNISFGIQAIRDRKFLTRIPVQSKDELGEVSSLMNQVMEGMQDLEVAREIQETLFPQNEICMSSLTIHGRSRTMTDVGGDYFDYFKIDDRHIFGVIGDVSGHGVSAALIMGMAKCFFTVSNRPEQSLGEILSDFNRFLFLTVKQIKMMTLIVFRWNADTMTINFGNAGHVSPLLRRVDSGNVEEIFMPCMPLGVAKRTTFQTKEVVLKPGDSIFLCTDGLPEAKNPQNREIGYELPMEWFAKLGNLSPKDV
ncbi:SpoIIE family protein phosphatase, partial [bacterium]|nr:SpoIIE family protein phosphatase [bacterium]